MRSIILLLVLIISSASFLYGKDFYPAKITYLNGNIETGYAKVPNNVTLTKSSMTKVVFLKKQVDAQPKKIQSDDIFTITFMLDGQGWILERASLRYVSQHPKTGKVYEKLYKEKTWLLGRDTNKKMNFYSEGEKYNIVKNKGKYYFKVFSSGQAGFVENSYYLRRPSESRATYIPVRVMMTAIGIEKIFRRTALVYFADNLELVEKIKKKKLKSVDLYEIYNIYVSD